jgi:hypothetical protein
MMVAYEIHTFRDGAWKIDSIFDDKDLALLEAQRVDRGNRFSGVRVVEETFDEATDRTVTRTIFRSSKADRINAATAEQRKQPSSIPEPPKPAPVKKPKPSITRMLVVALLTLAAILFGSLGALYALNSVATSVGH